MGALGSESEFKPSCFVHSMYSEANQFKGQSSKALISAMSVHLIFAFLLSLM